MAKIIDFKTRAILADLPYEPGAAPMYRLKRSAPDLRYLSIMKSAGLERKLIVLAWSDFGAAAVYDKVMNDLEALQPDERALLSLALPRRAVGT